MEIRQATKADYLEIASIYTRAREYMKETGHPTQWKNTYPTEEIILSDIDPDVSIINSISSTISSLPLKSGRKNGLSSKRRSGGEKE